MVIFCHKIEFSIKITYIYGFLNFIIFRSLMYQAFIFVKN